MKGFAKRRMLILTVGCLLCLLLNSISNFTCCRVNWNYT